jgi:hypothetical protein
LKEPNEILGGTEMKIRWMISLCLAVILYQVNPGLAQSSYSLDIDVEGPWVLYKDYQFSISGVPTPVLVLMAPDVMHSHHTKFNHQPPFFTEGDGVPVYSGFFCVQFADKPSGLPCNPKRTSAHPSSTYWPPDLLQVNVKKGWSWSRDGHYKGDNRSFIILPIPDSMSNDGIWNMRFAAQYDATGIKYTNSAPHSIGVYLHYDSVPDSIQLFKCNEPNPGAELDAAACQTSAYSIQNRGGLRIEMKTPDNNNACDPHVRYAHQQMLMMLDKTPIYPYNPSSLNLNQSWAYIDPAIREDNGNPVYTGQDGNPPQCLTKDPQKPQKTLVMIAQAEEARIEFTLGKDELTGKLNQIVGELFNFEHLDRSKPCNKDEKEKDHLLACDLQADSSSILQSPNQPTYSQLLWTAELLRNAAEHAKEFEKSHPHILDRLKLIAQELALANSLPTKNGNDCRADVMMATQLP